MTPWVSFDGKNCGGCKHLNERGYCKFTACIIPCTIRTTIPEVKPQTNADRIRAMTDEELAHWIDNITTDAFNVLQIGNSNSTRNAFYWLSWLKQEVKDNE